MWDAGDVDCRMRFIGTNYDIGIRCRGSVRQTINILRSHLALVDGIVARQIVIAAIIVWVENHHTLISIVEMAMETVAGSGYECHPSEDEKQKRAEIDLRLLAGLLPLS